MMEVVTRWEQPIAETLRDQAEAKTQNFVALWKNPSSSLIRPRKFYQ